MPHLALSPRHLEQLSSRAHMPQRGIKTYCRPKIAPRAHFWMRRIMLPTASWIAFASDVMSGCHAFYNARRCYPICHCFCLSLLGFLAFSACGSLSKQHTTWLSCIYIYIYLYLYIIIIIMIIRRRIIRIRTLCYVMFVKWYCILHGVLVYSPCYFHNVHGGTGQTRKATRQSGNNNMVFCAA